EKVDEVMENSNREVELKEKVNFLYSDDREVVVINLSAFKNILSDLRVEDREKIVSKFNLSEDEVGYIESPGTVASILEEDIVMNDKKYDVKISTKAPVFGNGVPFPCIIVRNEEYETLKSYYTELQFNGIILDNPENTGDL